MKKLLLSLGVIVCLNADEVWMGQTWDFAEKNFLDEIHEYINQNADMINAKVDTFKNDLKTRAANYIPDGVKQLPKATKNRVFYPDMTYENTQDIKDHHGNILYPKGFKFSPTKYISLPYSIVVLDATDDDQMRYIHEQNITDSLKYKILITDGKATEVSKALGRPVFYAVGSIQERFRLEKVPSIIRQKGEKIEVSEICLDCNISD